MSVILRSHGAQTIGARPRVTRCGALHHCESGGNYMLPTLSRMGTARFTGRSSISRGVIFTIVLDNINKLLEPPLYGLHTTGAKFFLQRQLCRMRSAARGNQHYKCARDKLTAFIQRCCSDDLMTRKLCTIRITINTFTASGDAPLHLYV